MEDLEPKNELKLTKNSRIYLEETRKWTLFLSIVGFVFIGLMFIIAFFAGSIMNKIPNQMPIPGSLITAFYILGALLYFFPIYYLFQFSTKMKLAIQLKEEQYVEDAFRNLKSHYKFMGIFMAVILIFYVLIFFGAILFSSLLK
jgi:hypothetical protein